MPHPAGLGLFDAATTSSGTAVVPSDWQRTLPALWGEHVVLREMRDSDAASLFTLLTTDEVSRFISPPPSSIEGFEHFIDWAHRQRASGKYVCFAVTLKGFDTAIGIFQVRQVDTGFDVAEWGFALGSAFWGTGVFQESAELVLDFAFETLGVRRLEARAAVQNGRGNGALVKIGAIQEAILRKSFVRHGQTLDQVLYAILAEDRRAANRVIRPGRFVQIH
ncbi:MAG TPA: GNAT family protein [Vicinamibacterales bacterium]|jgi:RimJ/RimL family protein N-acetyltransferase